MTLFLTDIASYQAGLVLGNIKPDCVGVFVKATQGVNYVDPFYAAWRAEASKAGLLFAAYHYDTTDDVNAQVAHIAANIGDKKVPLMFDVEKGSGDLANTINLIKASSAAGLNPRVTYLPKWYWEQIGSPDLRPLSELVAITSSDYPSGQPGTPFQLYPGDSASGWASYGGITPTFYQFTDMGLVGGQKLDVNAYRGSMEQLAHALGLDSPVSGTIPFPGRILVYTPSAPQMHGNDVQEWQQRMRQRGWAIGVDGWYGPQSTAFCVAFQKDSTAHGWPLAADGKVGPLTWKATFERPVSR